MQKNVPQAGTLLRKIVIYNWVDFSFNYSLVKVNKISNFI